MRLDAAFVQAEAIFLEAGDTGAGERGQAEMSGARGHMPGMKNLELIDEETNHQKREAIRRCNINGEPVREIARRYNVHPSTISRLANA